MNSSSKYHLKVLLALCLAILVTSCSLNKVADDTSSQLAEVTATPLPFTMDDAASSQSVVDAMTMLVKGEGDVDVNSFFAVLNHLSMEPGYVLDYVYLSDQVGGRPLVYARPETQPAYPSYAKYIKAMDGTEQNSFESLENSMDYLNHIVIDNTAEGYFQFVVLSIMGDQFDLSWHGGYNDTKIICDHDGLEAALKEADDFLPSVDILVPEDVRQAAQEIDFKPNVEFLDEKSALVRFVIFTKWGGFFEVKYTISRDFPHAIIDGDIETLVEYDCGVLF